MQSQDLKKQKLPDTPGVYFFKLGQKILYIGKATSLKDRVKSYFSKDLIVTRGPLIVDMVFRADKIDFVKTNSVLEALILENNLIKKHKPYYNTKEKDDRSYYYVVITKEKFPRVLIVRGREIEAGQINHRSVQQTGRLSLNKERIKAKFGPYPNAGQLKTSLEIIRKIFPYRDKCEPGQAKPCFNYQIGLCPGVCIGEISEKDYKKRVKNIELFLNSKTSVLIKGLEKEMKFLAKEQKFEQAQKIRNTIFALNHIRDVSLIKEDSENLSKSKVLGFPPFADEVSARHFDLEKLSSYRIEAYDAAHLAGTNNVGVMVVMEDGELKRSDYRKFKIKESKGSDVDALREMLTRRFNHPEWLKPDFIVIDGGIAQINTAKNTLKQLNQKIPIVAVTKDEHHKAKALTGDENLIKRYKKEILLINNEAHRFAIAFHRQKRSAII